MHCKRRVIQAIQASSAIHLGYPCLAAAMVKFHDINVLHGSFGATPHPYAVAKMVADIRIILRSGSRYLTTSNTGIFLGQPDGSHVYSLDIFYPLKTCPDLFGPVNRA